jgi:hypothetical protein
MDIYILRDGKEIGPFSEETTQSLLKQGSVALADLGWRPGMPEWIPLHRVLYPAQAQVPSLPASPSPGDTELPSPASAPAPVALSGEPATARQKAFLSYLGIPFEPELTKEQASLLISEAMETPKDPARIARWNEDRLRLHPDLFAAEIQARRENRAAEFLERTLNEGEECFTKVTKAHCQVLVGYLDVRFPGWDTRGEEATWSYFFPAIAEKFPQLVTREWKGKLNYASGGKVAPELAQRTGPLQAKRSGGFPLLAMFRGLFLGLLILGVLYGALEAYRRGYLSRFTAGASAPAIETTAPKAEPPPAIAPAGLERGPGNGSSTPGDPSFDQPLTAASAPPSEAPPPDGMTAPAPPAPPADSPPAGTAPVLDLSMPPETSPSSAPPATEPSAAVQPTNVVLTKPTEVQLQFGRIKLPIGTQLRLVSREGANLRVRYGNDILTIPASSTDLEAPAPPAQSLF